MSTMKMHSGSNVLFDDEDMSADATSAAFPLRSVIGAAINLYSAATGTRAGHVYLDAGPDLNTDHLTTVASARVDASTLLDTTLEFDTHLRIGRLRWEKLTGSMTGALTATLNTHEVR